MADGAGSPSWPPPERTVNMHAQLRSLRDLLNSGRRGGADPQRALEAIDEEERQRRESDSQLQDRDTPPASEDIPSGNSPSSLVRSRRRAHRPSERLQRHYERYNQASRTDSSDPVGNLRRGTPPPPFAESAVDEYVAESQVNREQRYRAKRRKLDDGTFEDETRTVSYGDEGRVTPGPLQMDIVQCDGGEYFQPPTGMAQHVLQDDKNVYSTKENRCNMLLRHVGGMPFSLTKIVIKAPSDGFDSPIQEGMVFVALNDEKLMENTSQYDKYSPKSHRYHHPVRRPDHYRPSQDYRQYSEYNGGYRAPRDSRPSQDWINAYPPPPLRPMDRSRHLREPYVPWSPHSESTQELETSLIPGFDISFADPSDAEHSPSFTPRSPLPWQYFGTGYSSRSYNGRTRTIPDNTEPPEHDFVTSSESEDEFAPPYRDRSSNDHDLDEAFVQRRRLLSHMRMTHERGGIPPFSLDESRWRQQMLEERQNFHDQSQRSTPSSRFARRPGTTPQPDPSTSNAASSKSVVDASPQLGNSATDILAPHARFSMVETQKSIAINFDPPVAGRYILVKLWASCPASNIDIQCIIPYGYGGPRFFPSIESR